MSERPTTELKLHPNTANQDGQQTARKEERT
jgi:hypothetical protein